MSGVWDDTTEVAEYVRRISEVSYWTVFGIDPSSPGQLKITGGSGIPDGIVVGISQGWKLGGAIKPPSANWLKGVLVHGDQPLMAWCVGNARVEPKGNAILITKQASGRGKIQPAGWRCSMPVLPDVLNPEPKKKEYAVFFI